MEAESEFYKLAFCGGNEIYSGCLLMFPFLGGKNGKKMCFLQLEHFSFLKTKYVVACVYAFSLHISRYIFLNVPFKVVWLLLLLSCELQTWCVTAPMS